MTKPLEWYEVQQLTMLEEQVNKELEQGSVSAKLAKAVLLECRCDPEKWRGVRGLLKELLDRGAKPVGVKLEP